MTHWGKTYFLIPDSAEFIINESKAGYETITYSEFEHKLEESRKNKSPIFEIGDNIIFALKDLSIVAATLIAFRDGKNIFNFQTKFKNMSSYHECTNHFPDKVPECISNALRPSDDLVQEWKNIINSNKDNTENLFIHKREDVL